MATYVVTYDLNKETKRPNILADIKSYNWAMLSESSYAIETTSTPKQVYDKLAKHIDDNDSIYIITIASPYYGQGPKEVNDWLNRYL